MNVSDWNASVQSCIDELKEGLNGIAAGGYETMLPLSPRKRSFSDIFPTAISAGGAVTRTFENATPTASTYQSKERSSRLMTSYQRYMQAAEERCRIQHESIRHNNVSRTEKSSDGETQNSTNDSTSGPLPAPPTLLPATPQVSNANDATKLGGFIPSVANDEAQPAVTAYDALLAVIVQLKKGAFTEVEDFCIVESRKHDIGWLAIGDQLNRDPEICKARYASLLYRSFTPQEDAWIANYVISASAQNICISWPDVDREMGRVPGACYARCSQLVAQTSELCSDPVQFPVFVSAESATASDAPVASAACASYAMDAQSVDLMTQQQTYQQPPLVPIMPFIPPMPMFTPVYSPVYTMMYSPVYVYAPMYNPTYPPTYAPRYAPMYAPTYGPTYAPTYTPMYASEASPEYNTYQ